MIAITRADRRMRIAGCPFCRCVVLHNTFDVGLLLAFHVGGAHPERLYSEQEIERRRLTAQLRGRLN